MNMSDGFFRLVVALSVLAIAAVLVIDAISDSVSL